MANSREAQRDNETLEYLHRMATRQTVWMSARRGAFAALVGTVLGLIAVGAWVGANDPLKNTQDPLGGLILILAAAGIGTLSSLIGYLAVAVSTVQSHLPDGGTARPTLQVAAAGILIAPAMSMTVLGALAVIFG